MSRSVLSPPSRTTASFLPVLARFRLPLRCLSITGMLLVLIAASAPTAPAAVSFSGPAVDPSGFVRTLDGTAIPGATVTLFRSDTGEPDSFTQVPDGSTIMSPANRTNPDLTDADGSFGWDVIAGYYIVRAESPGCTSPDHTQSFVESPVLTIPPSVTDLDLRLDCDTAIAQVIDATLDYQAGVGDANDVTVSLSVGTYTIQDPGSPITPVAGCSAVSANEVTCDATGVNSIHIDTGDLDDTVSQTSPTPSLVEGGSGADSLRGGSGADTLDGGADVDLATYATRTTRVRVTLDNAANDGAAGEGDNVKTEDVAGGTAADTLSGSAGPNLLQGRAGDDSLYGNAGNDLIDGSGGNDRMIGGAGADLLNGNGGIDTADYSVRATPVVVTVGAGANDGGAGEGDNVRAEVVLGGSAADHLTGDGGANTLVGGAGDDTLDGGLGADVLRGLDGNDSLLARDGVVDTSLECDGGATPGAADSAEIDIADPAPTDCESVSPG